MKLAMMISTLVYIVINKECSQDIKTNLKALVEKVLVLKEDKIKKLECDHVS